MAKTTYELLKEQLDLIETLEQKVEDMGKINAELRCKIERLYRGK